MKTIYRSYSDLAKQMANDDHAFAAVYDRYFGVIINISRRNQEDGSAGI